MKDARLPASRQGLVICISGPSGVGKGTVIEKVMELQSGIVHSVSVTTRPQRPGEQEGLDYYFRSPAEFLQMQENGEILESDVYCEHYYGTPRRFLDQMVSQGKDVLMDITVSGSMSVMTNFPDAVTIFLLPPTFSELQRRLALRGTENDAAINRRLLKAREEIGKARQFQYIVINDDLGGTARKILAIIAAEHCRTERQKDLVKSVLAL